MFGKNKFGNTVHQSGGFVILALRFFPVSSHAFVRYPAENKEVRRCATAQGLVPTVPDPKLHCERINPISFHPQNSRPG